MTSLGQLTADYADSDAEDELLPEVHNLDKSNRQKRENKKSPSPQIPPVGSPLEDLKTSLEEVLPIKEVSDTKDSANDDSRQALVSNPPTSPSQSRIPALTGIIVDEDDDTSPSAGGLTSVQHRVREFKAFAEDGGGRATPSSNTGSVGSNKNTPVKKVNRLVSYYNEEDDLDDDTDTDDEVLHSEPMDTGTDGDDDSQPTTASLSGGGSSRGPSHPSSPHGGPGGGGSGGTGGSVIINGIKLPPAPVGKKCSQALQDKVAKAVAAVLRGQKDYNTLQNRKEFRNPSIYEKLVEHLRLDENGTNYPVALYDPLCWGKESFYDELARLQKEEMEKREKDRKERTKVDFVSGTKKIGGVEEEIKKRKSRFDSGRPEGAVATAPVITKPVGLMSNLPTSIAAPPQPHQPKTSIDAFGSLNKKLKS